MANVLAAVRRLTASGFSEAQAEAVIETIADVQDDLATRSDLQAQTAEFNSRMESLRADMQEQMAALRSDMQDQMANLRSDMQEQMANLRLDMKEEMAALRSDMKEQAAEHRSEMQALELRLTIRIGAVVGATSLVTVGVLAALIALL